MIPNPIKLSFKDGVLVVAFADGKIFEFDPLVLPSSDPRVVEIQTSPSILTSAFLEDYLSITWNNGFSLDPDVVYLEGKLID